MPFESCGELSFLGRAQSCRIVKFKVCEKCIPLLLNSTPIDYENYKKFHPKTQILFQKQIRMHTLFVKPHKEQKLSWKP